ncbi:antibiotic biosynthesis monooxygenase [Pseudomonas cavernae]|uniref:Antibiotic biosynthesis monooxygenase n=1 Tax=Pseudomonas cavernae TaxID=2320867 RepID=A0A385Z560_9PSED|nr:antibiotic biosynthesis monooxygenase [Pseudomonas cavernae]AYC32642.1 antibiotic biosynthesis monooxygenase [Pseudomonas cavernae]
MTTHHLAYVRACRGRSTQLGAYLRDLQEPVARLPGCLAFNVEPLPGGVWRLQGSWESLAARQRFFTAPLLQEMFSGLLRDGLLGSLECQSDEHG